MKRVLGIALALAAATGTAQAQQTFGSRSGPQVDVRVAPPAPPNYASSARVTGVAPTGNVGYGSIARGSLGRWGLTAGVDDSGASGRTGPTGETGGVLAPWGNRGH